MKRIVVVVTFCWAFSFLSPLVARAMDVEYPPLGIKLTNLPDDAKVSASRSVSGKIGSRSFFAETPQP